MKTRITYIILCCLSLYPFEGIWAQTPSILLGYYSKEKFIKSDTIYPFRYYDFRIDSAGSIKEITDIYSHQLEITKGDANTNHQAGVFDLCLFQNEVEVYLLYNSPSGQSLYSKTTIPVKRHFPVSARLGNLIHSDSVLDKSIIFNHILSCDTRYFAPFSNICKCDYSISNYRIIEISDSFFRSQYISGNHVRIHSPVKQFHILIDQIRGVHKCDTIVLESINGCFKKPTGSDSSCRIYTREVRNLPIGYSDVMGKEQSMVLDYGIDYYINGTLRARTGMTSDSVEFKMLWDKYGHQLESLIISDSGIISNIHTPENTCWIGAIAADPLYFDTIHAGWTESVIQNFALVKEGPIKGAPKHYIHYHSMHQSGKWKLYNSRNEVLKIVEFYLKKAPDSEIEVVNPDNLEDPTDLIDIVVPTYLLKKRSILSGK